MLANLTITFTTFVNLIIDASLLEGAKIMKSYENKGRNCS